MIQLVGYVSQHAAYHHGDMSLSSTIIGLAQNYVGANNINLLEPSGQFGTRLQAHPRPSFTAVETCSWGLCREARIQRVLGIFIQVWLVLLE